VLRKVEKLEIKVPAHIDYLGDLRDFITNLGERNDFSEKLINAFKLAVDEAATNIIRHAYRDHEGLITMRAYVKTNGLTLCIIDQGTYFDPKRVKDPDLNRYIDIGKKGGLGIFIMRKLMDDIDYRKTEEGNELRITKYDERPLKKKLFNSVSPIPFTIKAQYFFRTIAVITTVIAVTYLYFYMETDDVITEIHVAQFKQLSSQINSQFGVTFNPSELVIDEAGDDVYKQYKAYVKSISVEDSTGIIQYNSSFENLFGQFRRPADAEQVSPGVHLYKDLDGETVYEYKSPLVLKVTGRLFGYTYVLFPFSVAEQEIASQRWDYFNKSLFVFGIANVGVALLLYIVMNPLRKLSEWVRNIGQGDLEDEIEIEGNTEIGEIAQAFSGMTQKLRESQKSLVDQERLQKEMQLAQEIQQTLLPMEFPEVDGYEIASYYEAAKEVGGDYYDFVEVDKDTLGIAVADVSGKGVPGSLVMTMIRTALRTEARGIKDAAKVLSKVNAFVSNDIKKGMFVTVFYIIIDSKKRSVNYASAGHNPMILYRGSTQKTYYLNPKGFPIGVQLPEKDYFDKYIQSETVRLTKDDILLLYTDGITEAMNSRRELYGEERLLQVLRKYGKSDIETFVERLKDGIYAFTEGAPQYDDITLVGLKEESTREEDEYRRAREAHQLIMNGVAIKDACDRVNLSTYAYYNKYKKVFEEDGVDAFEVEIVDDTSVEAKHVSIEDKTKLFDVIRKFPEFGAARIREELNSEKYAFCELSETQIYEELVRNRLNTRALREAFVNRARVSKARMKPPGTPMMTIDGKVVIHKPGFPHPLHERSAAAGRQVEEDETRSGRPVPQAPDRGRKSDANIESDAFIEASLEDLLADGHEDDSNFDAEESPRHSAGAGDEGDSVHASIGEIIAADYITEIDDDFDDRQIQKNAASEDDPEETPREISDTDFIDAVDGQPEEETAAAIGVFSSAELISNVSDEVSDNDFDDSRPPATIEEVVGDEDPDEAGIGTTLATEPEPEREQRADETEIFDAEVEHDEVTDEITADYEELLCNEDIERTFEEALRKETFDEDSGEGSDGAEFAVPPEEPVSFSDLLQSLDDEIVYVRDMQHRNGLSLRESGDEAKRGERENKKTTNGTKRAGVEPAIGNNGADSSSHNKELILINGIRYYKSNDYDNAIREFKKVIAEHPDYKEAHSILGNAYFRNRMFDEAADAYRRVKEIDPSDVTAYENMGVIYANRGEYKEAVSEWERVLELSPGRTDIEEKIQKASRMY
jgi:serine phosphatase RsbU (regulator of sigma subunit)/anti-sigma regulatory factor (Ser/Thr protein kinase)/tetratricopeptide (TPR) repeat protein